MVLCPACKSQNADDAVECAICGVEIDRAVQSQWLTIGAVDDKLSADLAREILEQHEIPVVVFSRSGAFGTFGLPLQPFYRAGADLFEIIVPQPFEEEAVDLLDATLGDSWRRKER